MKELTLNMMKKGVNEDITLNAQDELIDQLSTSNLMRKSGGY